MKAIKKEIEQLYNKYELNLKAKITYEISRYKNDIYSFHSGMGVYFFSKNGINLDHEELPKRLLKIIKDIDYFVDEYNFYPCFDIIL